MICFFFLLDNLVVYVWLGELALSSRNGLTKWLNFLDRVSCIAMLDF